MIAIIELQNTIAVLTPKGDGKCFLITDYGPEINSVWKVRMDITGQVINFYDDDIIMYPNLMNGEPPIKKL